ncbi:TPA: hypothetical protein ACHOZF_004685, partial [Raoultella planticola]
MTPRPHFIAGDREIRETDFKSVLTIYAYLFRAAGQTPCPGYGTALVSSPGKRSASGEVPGRRGKPLARA